jgi:phosphoribosylformylglycinamidine synthase
MCLLCSRHWFFGAKLILDGKAAPETLMEIVKATLKANPNNSVIGFKDNSSAIRWPRFPEFLSQLPSLHHLIMRSAQSCVRK